MFLSFCSITGLTISLLLLLCFPGRKRWSLGPWVPATWGCSTLAMSPCICCFVVNSVLSHFVRFGGAIFDQLSTGKRQKRQRYKNKKTKSASLASSAALVLSMIFLCVISYRQQREQRGYWSAHSHICNSCFTEVSQPSCIVSRPTYK